MGARSNRRGASCHPYRRRAQAAQPRV